MISCGERPGRPQRAEVLDHPRQEDVVPAAGELDRRADVADRRRVVAVRPVRRVGRHLVHPLAEEGDLRAERALVELRDRDRVEGVGQRPPQAVGEQQRRQPPLLHLEQQQPRQRRVERHAAAPVGHPAELRRGHRRRHRVDMVGDRPLHDAHVARPDRPDRSGVPRLPVEPAQRRQPVGSFVERVELPAGAERPAHALHHRLQPALGQQPAEQEAERVPAAVRGAHEHGRRRPGARRGVAVGVQDDAVVHLDREIALDDDLA